MCMGREWLRRLILGVGLLVVNASPSCASCPWHVSGIQIWLIPPTGQFVLEFTSDSPPWYANEVGIRSERGLLLENVDSTDFGAFNFAFVHPRSVEYFSLPDPRAFEQPSITLTATYDIGTAERDGIDPLRDFSWSHCQIWGQNAATFPGDSDFNRVVDMDDFLTLSRNFALEEAEWAHGDFDADGVVGFGDFLTLSRYFGSTVESVSVPEPQSSLFFVLPFLVCADRIRRMRSRGTEV